MTFPDEWTPEPVTAWNLPAVNVPIPPGCVKLVGSKAKPVYGGGLRGLLRWLFRQPTHWNVIFEFETTTDVSCYCGG